VKLNLPINRLLGANAIDGSISRDLDAVCAWVLGSTTRTAEDLKITIANADVDNALLSTNTGFDNFVSNVNAITPSLQ
jgi:hypothetical protein